MLRVFHKLFHLTALIVQGVILHSLLREIEVFTLVLAIRLNRLTTLEQSKLLGKTLLFVLEHSLHFILRLDAAPRRIHTLPMRAHQHFYVFTIIDLACAIVFLHETSHDSRQLLVGILPTKLAKSLCTSPGNLLFLRLLVDRLDILSRLVEHVLELSICLLELPTELHIHVRSDGCPHYKCDP